MYAVSLNVAGAAEPGVKEKPKQAEPAAKAPKGSHGKNSDWKGTKYPMPQTETEKGKGER